MKRSVTHRLRSTLLAIVVGASVAGGAAAQDQAALRLDAVRVANEWLLKDCGLGSSNISRQLVDLRAEVVPLLVRAFREGPPEDLKRDAAKAARQSFEQRREWLTSERPKWLDDEAFLAMKAETARDAESRELQSLDAKYHQQALNGLALAGGDEARRELETVARDSSSPYRQTAINALRAVNAQRGS